MVQQLKFPVLFPLGTLYFNFFFQEFEEVGVCHYDRLRSLGMAYRNSLLRGKMMVS